MKHTSQSRLVDEVNQCWWRAVFFCYLGDDLYHLVRLVFFIVEPEIETSDEFNAIAKNMMQERVTSSFIRLSYHLLNCCHNIGPHCNPSLPMQPIHRYTEKHIDIFNGQSLTPGYMRLNPHGWSPTLVTKEEILTESLDIVKWADRQGSSLGGDAVDRTFVSEWLTKVNAWDGNLFAMFNSPARGMFRKSIFRCRCHLHASSVPPVFHQKRSRIPEFTPPHPDILPGLENPVQLQESVRHFGHQLGNHVGSLACVAQSFLDKFHEEVLGIS
ncbi:uncharacterized protein [Physcomitrium patens]|uniref:uncharacterized protein isoform X10 n=1 Tax=Physcomitrium patens TaxID=3218 RepID=UPI003CCCB615